MTRLLTVPLFPLPATVLFPGVRLPFYVFEPRYRQMLQDVLDGPGLLGVPLLLPDFGATAQRAPPIAKVFGVGLVTDYVTHDDGTSHIEVLGRWKVRLLEELPRDVYRRARVEVLERAEPSPEETLRLRRELQEAMAALKPLGVSDEARESLDEIIGDQDRDVGSLVNLLSTVVVGNPQVRQMLLEVDDIGLRCGHFMTIIRTLIQELTLHRSRRKRNEDLP